MILFYENISWDCLHTQYYKNELYAWEEKQLVAEI